MTPLEDKMYLALLGARTIVAAAVNVNPTQFRIQALVDQAMREYKAQQTSEQPAVPAEETSDAA